MIDADRHADAASRSNAIDPKSIGHKASSTVFAIVPVHNRLALTQRCLRSLASAATQVSLHVILVDDGSTDGTAEWVAANFPGTTVLRGNGHLWFGGSIDAGLDYVREKNPDYVLLLNNDSFMRPNSVDEMVAASNGLFSVAAALFIEDHSRVGTAGFRWDRVRGLVDVWLYPDWQTAHRSGSPKFLPVDAVATTACLHPMALLARAAPVNLARHPQNRYDAVLSAHLRNAGAHFLVSTNCLANHVYGPLTDRPTLRTATVGKFIDMTFRDRRSVYHVLYTIDALWITAPSRPAALIPIVRLLAQFLRQTIGKLVQVALHSVGIKIWN